MALINCPECTKQISTDAASCPHCGLQGVKLKGAQLGLSKYPTGKPPSNAFAMLLIIGAAAFGCWKYCEWDARKPGASNAVQMAAEQAAPSRVISANETPEQIRTRLSENYANVVQNANSGLNFIKSRVSKVGRNYRLWAVHPFFNKFSFQAGPDANLVSEWISIHHNELLKANISQVGLQSDDESSCWYEVK